jgi:hypothetical protein
MCVYGLEAPNVEPYFHLPRDRVTAFACTVRCHRPNAARCSNGIRAGVSGSLAASSGQRARTWASRVGQPGAWRTTDSCALPSTASSGTALQCWQANSSTVSVCLGRLCGRFRDALGRPPCGQPGHRLFTVYDRESLRFTGKRRHRWGNQNRCAGTARDNKREPPKTFDR